MRVYEAGRPQTEIEILLFTAGALRKAYFELETMHSRASPFVYNDATKHILSDKLYFALQINDDLGQWRDG